MAVISNFCSEPNECYSRLTFTTGNRASPVMLWEAERKDASPAALQGLRATFPKECDCPSAGKSWSFDTNNVRKIERRNDLE